jgi:hypothetical protein
MRRATICGLRLVVGGVLLATLGGCPTGVETLQYIAGGTGEPMVFGGEALVNVLTPVSDLSLTGGTQVDLNWQAFATSRTSVVNVIIDEDQDPGNDNETTAFSNLPLSESNALVDTSRLKRGTYYLGVLLIEVGEIQAFGYAPGRIIVDQRPTLYFNQTAQLGATPPVYSARESLRLDRTDQANPRFNVSWQMCDPDSTNTVEILLDGDDTPNGNEILLFSSTATQDADGCSSDEFTFDLPTMTFEAGTYRILALVSDGANSFPFYAPGSIRLLARLAGLKDLRDLALPTSRLAGAVFEGFNPRDNAGSFVTSITDIDNDGFDDFIVLAQFAKPRYLFGSSRTGVGEAYLIYGRPDPFSGALSLNSVGTLVRGEMYQGPPETVDPIRPGRGITSFAVLSDWDRDGVREMAFGVPFVDSVSIGGFLRSASGSDQAPLDADGYFRSGAVVIAAGSTLRPDLGFPGGNVFNLSEFGTIAHKAISCTGCGSDATEAPAGCGCPEGFYGPKSPAPLPGCLETYYHGHLRDVVGTPNFGSVRLGCRLSSLTFGDQFGETISAWDFDSIVMAAPNRDPLTSTLAATANVPGAGVISVFYCDVKGGWYPWDNAQAPPAAAAEGYAGSAPPDGAGARIPHGGPYHYTIDDVDPNTNRGRGPGFRVDRDDSAPCLLEYDSRLSTPERTVRFWSSLPGARLSNAKGLRDFNADGLVDLVIGAPLAHQGAGACYIIFGRPRDMIMGGELQIEELSLGMNVSDDPRAVRIFDGIQLVGAPGERLGQSQDDAGDFNADGLGDVLIGSPLLNNRKGGAAVFFGAREIASLTQTEIPMAELPSRGLGVIFEGQDEGDLAGARVAGAGDIDRDGTTDILIAAPNRSVRLDLDGDGVLDIDRTECGVVYLVYGAPDLLTRATPGNEPGRLSLAYIGTTYLPGAMFIGRNSGDHLGAGLGIQGDRTFGIASAGDSNGDGKRDLLLGAVDASPRDRAKAGEVYLIYGQGE